MLDKGFQHLPVVDGETPRNRQPPPHHGRQAPLVRKAGDPLARNPGRAKTTEGSCFAAASQLRLGASHQAQAETTPFVRAFAAVPTLIHRRLSCAASLALARIPLAA